MALRWKKAWQFGLRDLAWITLVVALGIGWWMDRQQLQHRLRAYSHQSDWDASLAAIASSNAENLRKELDELESKYVEELISQHQRQQLPDKSARQDDQTCH